MKLLLVSLTALIFAVCVASASAFDLDEQIIAEDATLGANPGQIHVTSSGFISEGKVSLSVGHDLVCDTTQIVITLNPGSDLYQSSSTRNTQSLRI